MIRNLKALGLSLIAVLAMGALSASSASAVDHFTNSLPGVQPALMTGIGHEDVFTAGGTKFECTTARFAATAVMGTTEATVDAEYTGKPKDTPHGVPCTATGGDITVDMNGCHYVLTGNTTGSDNGTDATVWITCPTGKVIQITQPGTGATITVPPQTPTIGGVAYTNIKSPDHAGGSAVTIKSTVTGITYECHGFACHFGPQTSGQNATYTGHVIVTGYEDKDGLPTPVMEGARVGIEVS